MDVWIEDRPEIATAVIADTPWKEALDEIWAFVRAQGLAAGRNVMRYGERTEAGVELDSFTPSGRIFASSLPAGQAAVGVRRGPPTPEGIAQAHADVRAWAEREDHALTGASWEIYGHWRDDPDNYEILVGWPLSAERTAERP